MADIEPVVVQSILDTDLYKLTMQQAVLRFFPTEQATYKFTNRSPSDLFSKKCIDAFTRSVQGMSSLKLTSAEHTWLRDTCTYLSPAYLSYLSSYTFNPSQVHIQYTPSSSDPEMGSVDITITGPWVETILWEVPLMALLSESYFKLVQTDWTYDGQADLAYGKARTLSQAGCVFSEFGTRRRRSYATQDVVCESVKRAEGEGRRDGDGQGKVSGTSNVHFAMKWGLVPVGTIAHEWFMGVCAVKGYETGQSQALDLWEQIYPYPLLLSLTDTFSTKVFYKTFTPERAGRWRGLRQDSGDPFVYAPRAKEVYEAMGIEWREKTIVYSDGLCVDKVLRLREHCVEVGFQPSFGIGTDFTNDFMVGNGERKSKPLNMVIKLASLAGKPCVKISDELSKNTGDEKTVREVKMLYGIPV